MTSNPFAQTTVDAGAANAVLRIWRGENDAEGAPIYAEASYSDYDIIPRGEYVLTVTGLREPREEPNKFAANDPDAPKTRMLTAVEFEVAAGPHKGKRFLIDWLTLNLSSGGGKFSPSNLYRIFSAAVPSGGNAIGDMIGGKLTAYLTQKVGDDGDPKYMRMTFDTCAPVDAAAADEDIPAAFARNA